MSRSFFIHVGCYTSIVLFFKAVVLQNLQIDQYRGQYFMPAYHKLNVIATNTGQMWYGVRQWSRKFVEIGIWAAT